MLTCYDASVPPANPPETDAVLIYIGGTTPHIWTATEILSQPARYRVPCWVRSVGTFDGIADGNAILQWLKEWQVPNGALVMLDIETQVNGAYVNEVGSILRPRFRVSPYGSSSTIFSNPPLDGYWVAKDGPPAIQTDKGAIAQQYEFDGAYDLSDLLDTVQLWDTEPPPLTEEELMGLSGFEVNGVANFGGVGKANGRDGHILHVMVNPKDPSGYSLIDVTDAIATAYNQPPNEWYLVSD